MSLSLIFLINWMFAIKLNWKIVLMYGPCSQEKEQIWRPLRKGLIDLCTFFISIGTSVEWNFHWNWIRRKGCDFVVFSFKSTSFSCYTISIASRPIWHISIWFFVRIFMNLGYRSDCSVPIILKIRFYFHENSI